jgi:outer membrane immunogenic protein
MTKLVLATAAVVALAAIGAAHAADLPPAPAPAPVYKAMVPPPAYSWTGCYVDAGGGYGLWNQDHALGTDPVTTPLATTTTDGGRGWLGRFGGGCDFQVGSIFNGAIVIGAFGDYDVASLKGSLNEPFLAMSGSQSETSAWAAGGRIGYAVTPSMLWYFDGGFTQARFSQVNLATTVLPVTATGLDIAATTYNGWFLGSGTDTSLSAFLPGLPAGLFLRTEYRYSSYQGHDDPILVTATGTSAGLSEHATTYVQSITTALVFKFNWMGH